MPQGPHLALYHPEIPQNVGTLMRFCACMGITLDIIEPCGFVFTDKKLLRAGMDYMDMKSYTRHTSWEAFMTERSPSRLIATTPHKGTPYHEFSFTPDDIILMGPESVGLPQEVQDMAEERVYIPQMQNTRSLNVAVAASIITSEALRQLNQHPQETTL